ncbi:MAG: hypothetical protein ACHP8B_15690 [Terriglobales bacterium]
MKSAILTSILGYVALLVIGSGVLWAISAQGPGATVEDRATAGLILFVGVAMGISWILSRKRIRAMESQARMLRTRLHRMQK